MNELQIFNFEKNDVRLLQAETETWFAATDVCAVLEIKNTSHALSRLEDDEITTIALNDSGGRPFKLSFVNEYGLYNLVLGSRKPEAKKFKRWITHEVIPSIRKTGGYELSQPTSTKALLLAALEQEERLAKVEDVVGELKDTMRIDGGQEFTLKRHATSKVVGELGGKESQAYETLNRKAFSQFWKEFKNYFKIPRYGDLPKMKMQEAIDFIKEWTPDTALRLEIKQANNQTHLKLVEGIDHETAIH